MEDWRSGGVEEWRSGGAASEEGAFFVLEVRWVVESEARLEREVEEHGRKELVFREILSEAEVIVSSIEQGYHSRVTELDEARRVLEDHLAVGLQAEARLEAALRVRPGAGQVSHLLERLAGLGLSELGRKERLGGLEWTERELEEEHQVVAKLREEAREREAPVVGAEEQ